jgi:hypothetical protein
VGINRKTLQPDGLGMFQTAARPRCPEQHTKERLVKGVDSRRQDLMDHCKYSGREDTLHGVEKRSSITHFV